MNLATVTSALFVSSFLIGSASSAVAQNPWATDFAPFGIDGQARDLVVHDGTLYMGGEFDFIGARLVRGLARWDGQDWQAVIPDDASRSSISSFQELGSDLYFIENRVVDSSFQSRVCRLDGTSCTILGESSDFNPRGLAVHEGQIVAAGRFRNAADPFEYFVAAWDGSEWRAITGGTSGRIEVLASFRGEIVAGGDTCNPCFPVLARWDGDAWQPLGGGVSGSGGVDVLEVIGDALLVGGSFDLVDGVVSAQVGRWDGSEWHAMPGRGGLITLAFIEFEGVLYAGGNRLERWDGASWEDVAVGVGPNSRAFTVFDGALVTGGSFHRRNNSPAERVARWNGSSWESMEGVISDGVDGGVLALADHGEDLLVAGRFVQVGTLQTEHLALWDGAAWSPFPVPPPWPVRELLNRPDGLYAVEAMTFHVGLARWDGVRWQVLGEDLAGPSTQIDHVTVADLIDHPDGLLVVGDLDASGTTPLHGTALWNGLAWTPFAGKSPGGPILCGVLHEEALVVGGAGFLTDGGFEYILRWNGRDWEPLGGGLGGGYIWDLRVYDGDLIAAGMFNEAGGNPVNFVARWNGAAWEAMGDGVPRAGWRLGTYRGDLVLVDREVFVSGSPHGEVHRWNGEAWKPLGGEFDDYPVVMREHGDDLYFGGYFNNAGGVPASSFTYYREPIVPVRLSRFEGTRLNDGRVRVEWDVADADDHLGFHVHREVEGKPRTRVTSRLLSGELRYRFVDDEAPGLETRYWLSEHSRTGGTAWHGPLRVAASPKRPVRLTLAQNTPNPFQAATTISFQAGVAGHASMQIFDIAGREIARPLDEWVAAGRNEVVWDGRTAQGTEAAAGVYFSRLTLNGHHSERRMVRLP